MGYIGSGISRFNTADELTVTGDAVIDTTTLVVDSTNNRVGVLTASPATALDVTGTLTADGLTVDADVSTFNGATVNIDLMESDTTNANTRFRQSASGLSIQTVNDAASSATNRMRIDHTTGDISFRADDGTTDALFFDASTQQLGLGTTTLNSDRDLHLHTGDSGSVFMQVTNSTTGTGSTDGLIVGVDASENALLYYYENKDLYFGTNSTERMRLTSAGLLGVNTTSPSAQVDIRTAALGTALQLSDNTNYGVNFIGVSGGLRMKMNGTQTLTIDQANNANVLHINGSGKIGIGTASPTASKLQVDGTDGTIARFRTTSGSNNTVINITSNDSAGTAGLSVGGNSSFPAMTFENGGSERGRFTSDGKFRLNTTANQVTGYEIFTCNGSAGFKSSDTNVVGMWQTSSSGHFIQFFGGSGAAGCGNIGFINNNNLIISNDADNSGLQFGSGSITPAYDGAGQNNSVDLGSSSTRFKIGYFNDSVRTRYFVGVDDTNTYIEMGGSDNIKVFNGGSEKFRFGSDGAFSVGVTSTSAPGSGNTQAGITLRGAIGDAFFSRADGDAGYFNRNNDGSVVTFSRSGTAVGNVAVTTSNTAFNTSSDRRLKSNIQDAASASDKIDAIQVRQFDWNVDDSHQDYGLIAQELQPIEPLAVTGDADSDEMMAVDYSKLVPMLIKEIQELRSRVATLEAN